jgi:penicillin-binding protein 1A
MIAELVPAEVVATARKMGIESRLAPVLSLALGSADVTPLEMSAAFAALANGGLRVHPLAILKVTDARGKVLEEHRPRRELALEPDVAYVMTDLLKGVIERGTGRAAAIGRPAAGKTGTTDDYRNAWFIGYTPYLSTAVWVGNDDNTPMRRVVGGGLPAEIWAAFMKPATQPHPPDDWTPPEGVVVTTVCAGSWQLATPACPHPRREVFTRASAPSYSEPPPDQNSVEPAPLELARPRDGEPVTPPFLIAGTSAPGAMVTIEVSARTDTGLQKLVEVAMQTDAAGRFAYEFSPAARVSSTRYVITVSALALSGGRASRTLAVGPP